MTITKTNQYYYDKDRDCYNLVCENEEQRNKAPAPIKKKKPTFEKSAFIKYGSNFADQGTGSKIRTTYKDFDEGKEQPKRKTLKDFMKDAGSTTKPTKDDKIKLDYLYQVYLGAQKFADFKDFVGFIKHIS